MKRQATRFWASLLALAMLLSFAACSGGGGKETTAATMHLRRAEGTVAVSTGGGKSLPVLDNLGLYSGYGVGTRSASYAWIDLDEVRLTKLDQNSEISIGQEGKKLDIELKSGSLFFNVTEPLGDDETMNIRTSTMLVGIRGTCGWVEERSGLSRVYLLEGKVECSAEGQTVQVNAGEYAELTSDGALTVKEFSEQDIPAFVQSETNVHLADRPIPGFGHGTHVVPTATPEAPEGSAGPEEDTIASGEDEEGLTWALYSDGTLVISGTGPMDNYYFDNGHVGGADDRPWEDHCEQIHTVRISDGVTSIGAAAFERCALTSVSIPDSVTSIGDRAFRNCGDLTDVTIPGSVTNIGAHAFSNTPWLENLGDLPVVNGILLEYQGSGGDVVIPDSVTSIAKYAFSDHSSLTGVTIPDSVTSIGDLAFSGCSGLTEVTIPDSVTSMGADAFSNCGNLTSVTIGSGITDIREWTFYGCSSLINVTIPDSVTSIGAGAFYGCIGLTRVTIPDSVTSIGDVAFDTGSTRLRDIYYSGSESQWNQISGIESAGIWTIVTIHYNSTGN